MKKLFRLIDVNFNRLQEGLRVCEDIARFMLVDKQLTRSFKVLRHAVGALRKKVTPKKVFLIESRSVRGDVGKKSIPTEIIRKNIKDVFRANIQRSKESLRVLEEVTKLFDRKMSQRFKRMRFGIYELEKKARLKLDVVLHS